MYLSEEIENLIYQSNGVVDEKFKTELFALFDSVLEQDKSDDALEKIKMVYSNASMRHSELSADLYKEYLSKKYPEVYSLGVTVKVKKLYSDSQLPYRANESDAGMDLYVHSIKVDLLHGLVHYGTGIAMEIPKLHVGLAFPRSSIYKFRLSLSNSVGVIDAGYRGEVGAKFRLTILGWIKAFAYKYLHINTKSIYKVGERCCQMIILPYPSVNILEVDELSDSDRGVKGYGGSGR